MLYRALIVVFDTGSHKKMPFYLFGYLLPFGITGLTVVVSTLLSEYPMYHYEDLCWLKDEFRWTFMGPVILVLVFNSVMLFVGLR